MVTIEEIQTAYYMVAATGVLIAAVYYVMNMRATLETRRIGLMDSIIARSINEESMKNYFELLRYEWSDYEDFERKYGSENNVEAAAKRYTVWNTYDALGMMLRKGMVKAEEIFDVGSPIVFIWAKYKPIIEENRRRYNGQSYLKDFEYLYEEMMKVKLKMEPSYRVPETLDKYIREK